MWVAPAAEGLRVGFSAYAVRLLGDVHHLEWSVQPGRLVAEGQRIGYVEASKATSDLYTPLAGKIVALNGEVLARPGLVNSNLYDTGWLVAIAGDDQDLLSPQEYYRLLEASWPLAQRLLKGQAARTNQPPKS